MFNRSKVEVGNNYIIDKVDGLIVDAVRMDVSDIHIEPYGDVLRFRYRVDGELRVVSSGGKEEHSAIVTRLKIMASLDIAEKRLPQDGRISFDVDDREIDLRISTIPTVNGEKVVIRILDPEKFNLEKEELGITQEDMREIDRLTHIENGLILLVGPTGCGKSTTLYTIIRELNSDRVNIVTVEDPVECKIDGINQIQINEGGGIHFGNSLRSILRQDPEILLIGEIRDNETAEIAIRASITGHKVFSTIHCGDSYSAVVRLLDMGVEDYLLKSAINGVISQRLVKKLCPHCKERVPIDKDKIYVFRRFFGEDFDGYHYQAVGCDYCNDGYKGRMAIMEILSVDEEIKDRISKDINISELRKLGNAKGIKGIIEKGLSQVIKGATSYDEVMKLFVEE